MYTIAGWIPGLTQSHALSSGIPGLPRILASLHACFPSGNASHTGFFSRTKRALRQVCCSGLLFHGLSLTQANCLAWGGWAGSPYSSAAVLPTCHQLNVKNHDWHLSPPLGKDNNLGARREQHWAGQARPRTAVQWLLKKHVHRVC